MKIFLERRRLALAVVVTAAVAGLAAGLVYAHGQSDRALAQGPPHLLAQGKFRAITWTTGGTASMVREPSGKLKLRFSSAFMTKRAPELYVYLVKLDGKRRIVWKSVSPLRSTQGEQEYNLPSGAARLRGISVAIYCAECNQINSLAPLQPTRGA